MKQRRTSRSGAQRNLGWLLVFSLLGLCGLFSIAWTVVERVKGDGVTFGKMAQGKDLVADVLPPPAFLLEIHDSALQLLIESNTVNAGATLATARNTLAEYEQRHAFWAKADLPSVVRDKERTAYETGHAFALLFEGRLLPLIKANDRDRALDMFKTELHPAFLRHKKAVEDLVREARAYNAGIADTAHAQESGGKLLLTWFFVCIALLIVAWGFILTRRLSEERRLEQVRLESEEQYRFALEAATMSAWEWNIRSGEVRWSGVVDTMPGFGNGNFEGSYGAYLQLLHPDDPKEFEKTMADVLGGGKDSYSIEHRVKGVDGSVRWLESKGRVLREAGTPVRLRGTVADITHRKQAEAERERLESQLRQSQRMEAVGKLAGGVAHDFNNILTSIMGYCDLALRELAGHPAGEQLKEVQRSAERAAKLTRQLLAFSRKQVLQPELLDLKDVVRGLESMLERLMGSQIKFCVKAGAGVFRVKADRGQMEQVLLNLVLNARDAMPKGGTILVSVQQVERSEIRANWGSVEGVGGVLMLAVSDEGSGIPPELRANLFQPYFTTKPEGKGTGLGLSTVYGIVQQSGGAIGLDTEPGKGSTFRIYLAAAEGEPASGVHAGTVSG